MTKKIKIDSINIDTVTVDTYNTFSPFEIVDIVYELDNYNEDHKKQLTLDDVDLEWREGESNETYLVALSKMSIDAIEALLDNKDVIKSIEYVSCYSPAFYNFTTDSYTMNIVYDDKTLENYLANNKDEWHKWVEYNTTSRDGFMCFYTYDDMIPDEVFKLTFYLSKEIDANDYNRYMWDKLSELCYNMIELVKK